MLELYFVNRSDVLVIICLHRFASVYLLLLFICEHHNEHHFISLLNYRIKTGNSRNQVVYSFQPEICQQLQLYVVSS